MSFRRMLPFILINVLVSAAVVSAILYFWGSRQPAQEIVVPPLPTPTISVALAPVEGESEPAPTEEAEASEPEEGGPIVYTVQAGDTLGRIAEQFEVSMADIMAANGLDNPNLLSVGQQLSIPIGPLVDPAPEATEEPASLAPLPTITPAFTQGEAIVQVAEVIGVGSLTEESVLVTNIGSQSIGLAGWTLSDQAGFIFTFDQITLFGDGAGLRVHTEAGQDTSTDLYWGIEQAIWELGETVTLRDAEGTLRSEYVITAP